MTNWTYAPRYHSGARPFGTFAAKRFRTFNTWISNSDLGRDVAMVTTWPLNGNKIVNVTGGHGLSWNYSRTQAMTVMGYPGPGHGGRGRCGQVPRPRARSACDGYVAGQRSREAASGAWDGPSPRRSGYGARTPGGLPLPDAVWCGPGPADS